MYDDPDPRPAGNTTIKIVVIVGAVFICVVLVCGGVSYMIIKSLSKLGEEISKNLGEAVKNLDVIPSQLTADMFLEEIRAGRLENAYLHTTADFKKSMPKEKLEALVAKHPFLRAKEDEDTHELKLVQRHPTEHRFEASFDTPGKDRPTKMTIVMKKIGEEWKVDRLLVAGEPPEKADK